GAAPGWGAHAEHRGRGADQLQLTPGPLAPQRGREQRAHRVLDEGIGVAGPAEALAGGVAHPLVAPGVDDDDAVLERRYRPRQRLALDVAACATPLVLERLVELTGGAAPGPPPRPGGGDEEDHGPGGRGGHHRPSASDAPPKPP